MTPCPSPLASPPSPAVALITLSGSLGGSAYADDPEPSGAPPGSATTSPPPDVDANSPGLKLADGATLAPAKVLDIKSVVEDLSGDERREDTNQDVKFALQAEVLFQKDSSKLNPDAKSRIQAIADEIKAQKATNVRVFGFTDDLGSYAHGLTLSKKRAEAVHERAGGSARFAGSGHHVRGARLQRGLPDRRQQQRRGPQEEPPGGGVVPEGAGHRLGGSDDSGGSDGSADTGQ